MFTPGLPASRDIIDVGKSSYRTSFFSENSGYGEGCVPIYPKTEYWETVDENKKITPHSGTMIPLWLIYAWTIWKAQGQTIKSKVVVVIGDKEREHRLAYTILSGVTRASDIGIDGEFPRNCLLEKVKSNVWWKKESSTHKSYLLGVCRIGL